MFLKSFLALSPAYITTEIALWNQIQLKKLYEEQPSEYYQKGLSFNFASSKKQLLTLLNFINEKTHGHYPLFQLYRKKIVQLSAEDSKVDQEACLHWAKKSLEEHLWFVCHNKLSQPSILDHYTVHQCASGAASNLDMALRHFSMTSFDLALHTAKETLVRRLVHAYIQENHLCPYPGNEVHYVNAYFNYLANEYGCKSQVDEFAMIDPSMTSLSQLSNYVKENFTLVNFLDVLHTILPSLPSEAFDPSNPALFGGIQEYAQLVEPNNEALENSLYESLYDYIEREDERAGTYSATIQPKKSFSMVLNTILVSKLCRSNVIQEEKVCFKLTHARCIFNGQNFLTEKHDRYQINYAVLSTQEAKELQEAIIECLLKKMPPKQRLDNPTLFSFLNGENFIHLYKRCYLENNWLSETCFLWILQHPLMLSTFYEEIIKNNHCSNTDHYYRFAWHALTNPTPLSQESLLFLLAYLTNQPETSIENCLINACRTNAHLALKVMAYYDTTASQTIYNEGYTWAKKAVRNNFLETLDFLLTHGFQNYLNFIKDGSILLTAIANKNADIIKLLYNVGFDVNQINQLGLTPLWVAAQVGSLENMIFLFNAGAINVHHAHEKGATPLWVAAQNGHSEVAKVLINAGAMVNQPDNLGVTPLWMAAHNGHTDVIKILLRAGASVNQANLNGVSPLAISAKKNHLDAMSLLMRFGADIHQVDHGGRTPVYIAAQNGHIEILERLLSAGASANQTNHTDNSPLYRATLEGRVQVIRTLLKYGANINHADTEGRTSLWIAAATGKVEILKLFIQAGASLNQANCTHATPLWAAAYYGKTDTLRLLIENGANIYQTNHEGISPLLIALEESWIYNFKLILTAIIADQARLNLGIFSLPRILLKEGFATALKLLSNYDALNQANKWFMTPLLTAVKKNNVEVIKLLLNAGADANRLDIRGNSPLSIAAKSGRLEIFKLLVEAGADINHSNKKGKTPLWKAAKNGHTEMIAFLLENDVEINQVNRRGVSPLEIARLRNHFDIVTLLENENKHKQTYSFFKICPQRKKNENVAENITDNNL